MSRTDDSFDRRVRLIYDALDSRNAKHAVKLASTALEKYPENALVKSLKSIALVRTGKTDEANKVCDELILAGVEEEQALHLLKLSLKGLHRPNDITQMYERLLVKDPNNSDVLMGLFTSYVRQGDFTKQQQIATRLNKLLPSSLHLWWIVLSIILQARASLRGDATSGLGPTKLFQLAECMITRQVSKDGRLENYEALLVYIDILLAQGKTQQALELVTGSLGAVATMSAERSHLEAVLRMMMGDLKSASAVLLTQLREYPDDWLSFRLYCDCLMGPASGYIHNDVSSSTSLLWPDSSLIRLSGGLMIETLRHAGTARAVSGAVATLPILNQDDVLQGWGQVKGTVKELVTAVETPTGNNGLRLPTMRGPYLAFVEVAQRAWRLGLVSSSNVVEASWHYIQRQGHLVSCAADLRCYTSCMSPEDAQQLLELMKPLLVLDGAGDKSCSGNAVDVKVLRRLVCCRSIMDDLGLPVISTYKDAVQYAELLMQDYARAQSLYVDLDERERGPGDELPVLAASALISDAAQAEDSQAAVQSLIHAVLVLESCVSTRPFSAAMRLSLTALYTILGCPEAAAQHCKALDLKNIQMDTLASHHLLPALVAFKAPGARETVKMLLQDMTKLYDDHNKDAADTLSKAYQGSTFSKVLEFVEFQERMSLAHTRVTANCEKELLELSGMDNLGFDAAASSCRVACERLLLRDIPVAFGCQGGLRFNEDLTTRPAWYPPSLSPSHLMPAGWWQYRSSVRGQGYGRCWWVQPGCSESSISEPATTWRLRRFRDVRLAWLVPHVLSFVMEPDKQQEDCQGAFIMSTLKDLASCFDLTGMEEMSQSLRDRGQALTSEKLPLCEDLDMLLLSVLSWGVQTTVMLRQFTAAATADDLHQKVLEGAPDAEDVGRFFAAVMECVARDISNAYSSIVDYKHAVLPGAALNLASVLVNEHLLWLCLCIQGVSRSLKKKQVRADDGRPEQVAELLSQMPSLKEMVIKSCNSLREALQVVKASQETSLSKQTELAEVLSGGNTLWGWRANFAPALIVSAMMREQISIAEQVQSMSLQHAKLLPS
ncbi:hypothetical protein CEUSTIGMA_g8992.t1 [Chlamydomonas eustigma]|uniref:Uncharacterized protein n=1 Tax=Chlamydomonas eustigma TaxID=1157962 RepID=A0A250XEQ1_9CHLO|nr:hypothetical protein CEUSTIGMA_g8992.t1 [Chlamydomonas eustigma]|eukprot:GAX81564.1 hypothetical protein CEUSTIGMA_g8992.t1 [Chlamydomonas eustigma]